ncbi:MAG: Ig-like domain-containing protein [Candidatus Marinimicrobia bacterium]|jgi:hypothetical protein|nr:Ig-like domain-containing protein [Candidatus Neomarinimicrobiota bacterium]MDP6835772.1 Ig-like domain-containing protein [Candidatus Neomarinimicrobiota bacterium]
MNSNLPRLLLYGLVVALTGCAAVGPPPGGPVDKTAPELVSVEPPSGTTQIAAGLMISLTFSERLQETLSEKGVRIEPVLHDPPEVVLKKDKITVKLPDTLTDEQTYILTVTREIEDEHKNRLDKTYQLAYSTGSSVSQGAISGSVYDIEGKSSLVYLYKVKGHLDSLFLEQPDYYTETDDSGRYSFSHLGEGEYQLLAFEGGSPPAPLSSSRMPYGVHWRAPLNLSEERNTFADVNMKIAHEPKAFKVLAVSMESSRQGILRFSNPLELTTGNSPALQFRDTLHTVDISPQNLFSSIQNDEVFFYTDSLTTGGSYTLSVSSLEDQLEQPLEPFTRLIQIPDADSLLPQIVMPEPGKRIEMDPGDSHLVIRFSTFMQTEIDSQFFSLQDRSRDTVAIDFEWRHPTILAIRPATEWQAEDDYALTLQGERLRTAEGIALKDSIVAFKLRIGKKIGTGGLSGTVAGDFVEETIVVVEMAEKPQKSSSISVNSDGSFEFPELLEGMWLLSAFQDKDGNGRYTTGRAVPFEPAEPFLVLPDTIEVRANWETEGIQLYYPER